MRQRAYPEAPVDPREALGEPHQKEHHGNIRSGDAFSKEVKSRMIQCTLGNLSAFLRLLGPAGLGPRFESITLLGSHVGSGNSNQPGTKMTEL